ncbi:MAG TPA: diphthine--ammonia ligase [Anaerolineales bacterium]
MMKERVLVSWSGGKDSAMALHELLHEQDYYVVGLLTTVTQGYDRISMHGVRRTLLEAQASAIGLALEQIYISQKASNEEYEEKMRTVMENYKTSGVDTVVFGDIFLEDVREYREANLARVGMGAIFPLWKRDTRQLAKTFIDLGFRAMTTCVDTQLLGKEFAGRELDELFFEDLPEQVDPCGENGEYHTFVYDGPIFRQAVRFRLGESVLREARFYYCDLID